MESERNKVMAVVDVMLGAYGQNEKARVLPRSVVLIAPQKKQVICVAKPPCVKHSSGGTDVQVP